MRAIISIGSNLGDLEENLRTALRHLRLLSIAPLKTSSVWRTAPIGFDHSVPEFCNAVVIIESDLEAEVLLEKLQAIEQIIGRPRYSGGGYSSRVIDLDIIDFGGQNFVSSKLILPHPRAHLRNFVLSPLKEVVPSFRFLHRPESLEELIEKAAAETVRKTSRLTL